jgi:hypothetical protein
VPEFCFDKNLTKINEHLSVPKNKVTFPDLCTKTRLNRANSGQYSGATPDQHGLNMRIMG